MRHDTSDATLQAVLVLVTGELHAGIHRSSHGSPTASRPRHSSHTRVAERHRHGSALSTHWIRLSRVLPRRQGGDTDAPSASEDTITIGAADAAATAGTATESAETMLYFIQAGKRQKIATTVIAAAIATAAATAAASCTTSED